MSVGSYVQTKEAIGQMPLVNGSDVMLSYMKVLLNKVEIIDGRGPRSVISRIDEHADFTNSNPWRPYSDFKLCNYKK